MRDILGQPIVINLYRDSFMNRVEKFLSSCLTQGLAIMAALATITGIVRECAG